MEWSKKYTNRTKKSAKPHISKRFLGDIARILEMYRFSEMLEFYKAKYTSRDIFHLLHALVYFINPKNDPLLETSKTAPEMYLKRNRI